MLQRLLTLVVLFCIPAFSFADNNARADLSITIAPTSNVSGFATPMMITDKNQTVSTETTASLVQNEKGLNIAVSSSDSTKQLTLSNGEKSIPVKLICTPCGENAASIDFSKAAQQGKSVSLQPKNTSVKACDIKPTTCHFEIPSGHLQENDTGRAFTGAVVLTLSQNA